MRKFLIDIFRAIGLTALTFWGIISFFVFIFVIDRFLHPHTKGISNKDLGDYVELTIWLVPIYLLSRVIMKLFSKK